MPKVNAEYFENKRNEILDAAYRVCMRKPVYEVSMRDIIAESGLSQGGIYRYYANIDKILISLINRKSTLDHVESQIGEIIANSISPEKAIFELLMLWKRVFLDNLMGVGKIYYELSTLYANHPEKLKDFVSENILSSEQRIFEEKSLSYMAQKIDEGYFVPQIPFQNIVSLLVASLDGIVRDLILTNNYKINGFFPIVKGLNGFDLVHDLGVSLILLLGGNKNLLEEEGI